MVLDISRSSSGDAENRSTSYSGKGTALFLVNSLLAIPSLTSTGP
ncbi:MAG: hypothetical protein A4E29_01425 [Methanomassiliicoccales archaeon PtaB.Bin134]|nr:MAG: hypothetical protein A4E29_01425 [Methanomassiliicoccales archaeon PtaB.Bin134]